MARYEHLPIYKAALDVTIGLEKVVAGFSRYHKYTLGTDLRNGSRRVIEQVVRANAAQDRLPELIELRATSAVWRSSTDTSANPGRTIWS
jgi:hypothetical protein